MNGLLANAQILLDAAAAAGPLHDQFNPDAWTVLETPQGGLHLIAGADYSLQALAYSHGARSSWRISRTPSTLRVEALSGQNHLRLESPAPSPASPRLPSLPPLYHLA